MTRFRTGYTNAMGLDPTKELKFVEIEPGAFIIVDEFPKNRGAFGQLKNDQAYGEKPIIGKSYAIRFVERAFRLGLVWDWKDTDPLDVWVLQPILDKINRNLEEVRNDQS